jgi:hypothetical protein
MALVGQTKVNGTVTAGSGLGPNTVIVSVTDSVNAVTAADLDTIVSYLTRETATGSAFTVAGIAGDPGSDDVIHLALQGTGEVDAAEADQSIANTTVAVVCTFANS